MIDILKSGFNKLGLSYDDDKLEKLILYAKLLKEWNEKINLTSITDDAGIAIKHFLDSCTAFSTGRITGKVIDVGTGAGFPGLVLKIMKPEIELTLLDSLNKRLTFLKEVTKHLEINDVTFIHSRAEDGGVNKNLRESFDTVVSRAVAAMPVLSELCIPYAKVGGSFVALKGPSADKEVSDAKRAITILGGKINQISDVSIDGAEHKIVLIDKVKNTPIRFPRKPSLIKNMPIDSCYTDKCKRKN